MTTERTEIPKETGEPRSDLVYFDRVDPLAHFGLPAHPTVEQQLIYYSKFTDARSEPLFIRLWIAAQPLIKEWDCAALPDPSVGLSSITDPDAVTVIMWAGSQVSTYINGLDSLPKV